MQAKYKSDMQFSRVIEVENLCWKACVKGEVVILSNQVLKVELHSPLTNFDYQTTNFSTGQAIIFTLQS